MRNAECGVRNYGLVNLLSRLGARGDDALPVEDVS